MKMRSFMWKLENKEDAFSHFLSSIHLTFYQTWKPSTSQKRWSYYETVF